MRIYFGLSGIVMLLQELLGWVWVRYSLESYGILDTIYVVSHHYFACFVNEDLSLVFWAWLLGAPGFGIDYRRMGRSFVKVMA